MPSSKIRLILKDGQGNSKSIEAELCDTPDKRASGLMFKNEIVPLYFVFDHEMKYSIHSFFVKKEFDAIFIAGDGSVIEIHENIRPWRLIFTKKPSKYLLELPAGTARELGMTLGSRIEPEDADKE